MLRLSQSEIVRSTAGTRFAVNRRVQAGRLRQIVPGLYTTNLAEDLARVADRNLLEIVGMYFPAAVLVDRSAESGGRPKDGRLYVSHTRPTSLTLPGVTIEPRLGEGALLGDSPLPHGIYLSSTARALLDNARRSRRREDGSQRTLRREELEAWLERLFEQRGYTGVLRLDDEMDALAPQLGAEAELGVVGGLIGAMLGTRDLRAAGETMRARLGGRPYDPRRVEMFDALYDALVSQTPVSRPAADPGRLGALPFFEAYFSNFIEGTEFTVDEAQSIVLEGNIPTDRPADAYDIISTYRLVSDGAEMSLRPQGFEDLLELVRRRHAVLMERRPDKHPGVFKERGNQAGATQFVAPGLVVGTLERGYRTYQALVSPFARAAFMMFLFAEVHPFDDGNGRIARVMMNAELVSAGETRVVIPTSYRGNYLSALRALTHNLKPQALIATLDFAQRYVAAIDFTDVATATAQLEETKAFVDPLTAERENVVLRLPGRRAPTRTIHP